MKARLGQLPKGIDGAIAILAVAMALFHLVDTQVTLAMGWRFQNAHLFFALLLVFLTTLRDRGKLWPWVSALIILTLIGTGYIHIVQADLEMRIGRPTTVDIIIGFILVFLALEATRQAFGWILPTVCLVFVAYEFMGQYLPLTIGHPSIPVPTIASHLCVGFSGVFGDALGASASLVFYFLLFGGLLGASGATEFFIQVGNLLGRRVRSGAALSAVVGSSLVGMVTGSPMANVGITGSFTIPGMKRAGYRPEQAGGIEAAASTGGQITPPVMGSAAFLMAVFVGVPYIAIIKMAIIPALLFYISVGFYAHLQALRMNIRSEPQPVARSVLLRGAPLFFLSLIMLIALLVQGRSPAYAAFWTIVALIGSSLCLTRPSLSAWIGGFTRGAIAGARVGVTCAAVGMIATITEFTGLGSKLPGVIEGVCHGILPIALMLTAVVSAILGCTVHTVVAYILVALFMAPALVVMGVAIEKAHFFAMYWAVLANLTPPVAMASMAAAGLAGAPFVKTAFEGFKAGIVAFIVPFLIIYNPIMLGNFEAPLWGALSLVAVALGALGIIAGLVGHYLHRVNIFERVLLLLSGAVLISFGFIPSYLSLGIGGCLLAVIAVWQLRKTPPLKLGRELAAE